MSIVTINQAADDLLSYIHADIPVMLWGPPGVGKSDLVRQTRARLSLLTGKEWGLIDFRASLRDPTDLGGIPYADAKTGTTRTLVPDDLPQVERDGEFGILFMDELPHATNLMQGACFGLVLDRKVREYHLPKGWVVVAAGNRVSDRAGAGRLSSALRNRFAHIEIAADPAAWCDWALKNGVTPSLRAFIKFRPELLHVMPKDDSDNAFPTPRSWEQVGKALQHATATSRPRIVAQLVGDGASHQYEAFAEIFEWSQGIIDDAIANPTTAKVPAFDEISIEHALAGAVQRAATVDNFANIITYLNRLPREFEIVAVTDAVARDPSLKETAAFTAWALANSAVLT